MTVDPLPPTRRLTRSVDDRVLAGVCGGLANYFSWDPTVLRVVFGFLLLPVTPDDNGERASLPVVALLLLLGLPALCVFCAMASAMLGIGGSIMGGMMGR